MTVPHDRDSRQSSSLTTCRCLVATATIRWLFWRVLFMLILVVSQPLTATARYRAYPLERQCSCGIQIAQHNFCRHDFVFLAKRVNRVRRTFNDNVTNVIPDFLPFRGEEIRFRLLYSFKGRLVDYSKRRVLQTVFALRGSGCGLRRSLRFLRHKQYIISGFKHGGRLLLTSCSWISPIESLPVGHILGLFRGYFQQYCHSEPLCSIRFVYTRHVPPSVSIGTEGCTVPIPYRGCYDRHAICQQLPGEGSGPQCGFLNKLAGAPSSAALAAASTSLLSPQYSPIPGRLLAVLRRHQKQLINHFLVCLRAKDSNMRPP